MKRPLPFFLILLLLLTGIAAVKILENEYLDGIEEGTFGGVPKLDDSVYLHARFAVWTGKEIVVGADVLSKETDTKEFRIYKIYGEKKKVALRIPIGEKPIPGETAAWTGKEVIIFGGTENEGTAYETPDVYLYNPETNQLTTLNVSLPYPNSGKAALWDGRYVYLFLKSFDLEERFVYRFDPDNPGLEMLNVTYPDGFDNPGTCKYSTVWYRGRGYLVFRDRIALFDPQSLSFEWLNVTLPTKYYARSAVATDDGIFIFGGFLTWENFSTEIFKFSPEENSVEKMKSELPFPLAQAPVVWDGRYIYLIGGYSNGRDVNAIITYDYRSDKVLLVDEKRG
ncbi:Kelch repeat-containing protein [Palaeococcus ferrophilus]|uniref:hypothetical protein n=1 Tax=Palaeococcus ferrophilus TaxID=83868 RepID=UPI00064F2B9E|nr:hypothetical protein [Palaeococcus ferrophilus]